MIADVKKALEQGVAQNLLQPVEPDEETKKKFFKSQKKAALYMLLGSLGLLLAAIIISFLLISVTHVIVYSARIIVIILIILILPIYSIYNIFSVGSSIRKGDYDFYLGEVVEFQNEKYRVRGLENGELIFAVKPEDPSLSSGNRVIVARLKDELSLLEYRG